MHMLPRQLLALAFVAIVAIPVSVVQAQPAGSGTTIAEANVLVTVRIGRLEGSKRTVVKSYDLVVATGGGGSQLLSGARVPIPTTSESGDDVTAFVYQNIGFSTEARAWLTEDKRIKLAATIEDSRVVKGEGGEPPTVETRQLSVTAILSPGQPLEVTRVQGVTAQDGFVEVEVNILK